MPTLHLQLVSSLQVHGLLTDEPGVLLTTGQVQGKENIFSYSGQKLQPVCRDLQHLMDSGRDHPIPPPSLLVPMDLPLLQTLANLGQADDEAMLRLVLAYALTKERRRCSALLRPLVAADADLFDMLHRYRLEPWPVARYADLFGLSLRKFNQLFRDKFGMPAKQWLQQQRLEHAKFLLKTTSKKIIDVALESGFCNAAHFSNSFRQHFHQTPSEVRHGDDCESLSRQYQGEIMNIDAIVTQLNNQVSRTANDAQAAMAASDINNDPQAMLRAQYAIQQYSVMIGYESSVMKAVKDMMMGIISKIG